MTRTLRVLRQIVAPNGRHRARPVLLPDEPVPAHVGPVPHSILSEAELARLLEDGVAEPLESAPCPCCDRNTPHAMQKDGSRRCWRCGTTSPAEAA
ncbi:hypothetical protein ACFXKI_10025 [Streptomyces mirabilis]|uniref:hypothetical protein n=1 Tax=Streptomyces mirabilis TaxID=68239 RepID=UPI0036A02BDC